MRDTTLTYKSKSIRLSERVKTDIRHGRFDLSKPLPSENDLAGTYGASRSTIRRVISLLEDKGELIREPHRGVWINPESESSYKITSGQNDIKTSQCYSIAGVWAAYPDAFIIGMNEGIEQYSADNNLSYKTFTFESGCAKAIEVIEHIESNEVDGIIAFPHSNTEYDQALKRLVDKNFPVILVDRIIKGVSSGAVVVDNAGGMYKATNCLILKYRQPVFFFGPSLSENQFHPTFLRYKGYSQAMMDAGFERMIKTNSIFYEEMENNPAFWPVEKKLETPYKAAVEFLRGTSGQKFVVCMNDYGAKAIYDAAETLGLKIGEDIRVIGFDDLPMAQCLNPPMSTVRQPRMRIGYEAASLLHKVISGKVGKAMNITLPVELIERKSS